MRTRRLFVFVLITISFLTLFALTKPQEVSAKYFNGYKFFDFTESSSYARYTGTSSCDACPAFGGELCWNSESPGVTDCGTACPGGDPWTKYAYGGCYIDPDDIFGEGCFAVFSELDAVCSTADKCTSTNSNPYLNAGSCACTTGNLYKTCCTNTTPSYVINAPQSTSDSSSCVQLSVDTTNPPYEGVCPAGSDWIMCGVSQATCNDVIADGGRCTTAPCGQAACGPIAPVTCSLSSRTPNPYTQCGGTCNGLTYPSNHTIEVTESTCTDNTTQYSCSDLGVLAGQCGNPSTPPPSCSVSWTFSNTNPPSNTPVNVTVNGSSNFGWSSSAYSLDGGSWVGVSAPPVGFSVNSDSGGPHNLRFSAVSSGSRIVCGDQNSSAIVTQAPSQNDAATCTALSFNSPNIVASQNYTATVTMRNDGETTWSDSGSFPYRLGAQQPQDDPNWGTSIGADSGKGTRPTRVNLSSSVAPGSPTDFSFGVSAPDTAGTYRFSWQMLQEGIQWFGGMCAPNITVQAPAFTPSCSGTVTNPQTKTIRWDATVTPTTPPTGSYTYLWSGDASGTTQSITQTYGTTGTKNATVTVSNSGISQTANCSATIPPPGVPAVSLSATSPITSGSQTTLSWDISGNAQNCTVSNSGTPTITSGSWSGTLTGTDVENGNHTRPITMTSSASAAKTFNISCTNANGTSPTSSTTVIVNPPGLPPAPTANTSSLSCINPGYSGSGVNISWTNSGVSWVNISTDSGFGSYYHKSVAGSSTTAPNGFNLNPSNPPQPLTLNPNTTYYVRTWNNTKHSAVASFSIPACSGGPGPTTPPPGGGCGGSLSVAGHSAPATFSTSYRSTVSIAASAPTCFSVTLPDGNTQTTCSGSFNRNFDLSNVGPGTHDVSMTNRAWGGTCSLNVTINALQSAAEDCREQSSWSILTYAFNDSTYNPDSWPSYSWRQNNNYQCLAGNRFKTSQTCKTNAECNDGNVCTINDRCSGYQPAIDNDCDEQQCRPERMGICTYENQVPYTVCTKDAGGNPTKLCSTNSCRGYEPASSDGETDYPEVLGTCPAGGQSFCSINYVSCTDPKRNDQYCCGTTNIQGKGCQGQCNLTYYEGSPAKAGIVVHADGDQCGLNFTRTTDSTGKANFNPPRTVGSGRWGAIPSRVNYTVWAEVPSNQPFTRGTCSNTTSSIDPPALVTVTGNRAACGMTLSGGGFNAGRASFGFGVPAAPDPSTCSGNIILTLVPNPTLPLTTITAASSGLISCTGKPITIRTPDCNGVLAASCTSGTSGCNANLVVPPTAGTYTYAACIDKTSPPDGDCTDPGESDTTTLTVNPPGSSANSAWIQTTGGDVHSNVRIYTPGGP